MTRVILRRTALVVCTLSLAACANLAVVDEGRCYRGAQLAPERLESLIERWQLRTVLNLRGPAPGERWYDEEVEVCRRAGVLHESVRWSATRWPEPQEILDVLDVFDRAPAPLLVHCRMGADRAGLASALYRIHVKGEGACHAATELTWKHGHLGRLGGTGELDAFVALYARTGGGKDLRRWLREDYPALRPGGPGGPLREVVPATDPGPSNAPRSGSLPSPTR